MRLAGPIKALISALGALTPWLWWDLGAIVSLDWGEGALKRAGQVLPPACLSLSSWIPPGRSLSLPAKERSDSQDKLPKPILPFKFMKDPQEL